MKTKLFIAIISAIFSQQLLNAQTTYMPVFGDTTRYYTAYGINDGEVFDYLEFKKTNDSTVVPIGVAYPWNNYNHLVVNNSNSKIWGITQGNPTKRLLLMDLDMNVNDQYVDGGGHIHTADSVYWLNGRKHIRFEKQCVRLAIVDSTYFEFIEGVGNTISFSNFGVNAGPHSCFGAPWLRSQYKNGTLAYGLPEWLGYWDYIGSTTDVKNMEQVSTIHLSPSPVITNLKLEIPESANLKNARLSIYDINGKQQCLLSPTEHKIIVDVSQFSSGLYLLKISGSDYNGTVKFVKS
jgi:hypothetical protein